MNRKPLLIASASLALVLIVPVIWIFLPLPAMAGRERLSLTLEDRNGLPLRTTRAADGALAEWTPLRDVDPQLIQAFVALEDRRFFDHPGVDVRAIGRALVQDLKGGRVISGASTLTMQLARLLHPGGRGWFSKVRQAMWALRLERHLTKQDILEQYLNRVPLGQGARGVSAAAALYFDAAPSSLSLGQAALLAGLASAPSEDNPLVAPARARDRRATALRRMIALGYVSRDAADRAAAEPVAGSHGHSPFLAPHFTSRLLAWADSTGVGTATIRTSLDLDLQTELEAEVRQTVLALQDRDVKQAAAVVLNNETGEILAWVGSPDFWADTAGQVDMVVSPRQPGSALKPFLYAYAFDHGQTAATVLADVPRTYRTATGPYQPRNYDRRFHGPVRAREALASSFNVPAVDLTDRLGASGLLAVLHEAGFASLDESADHYGLGLALGNGDVTLLELANAYRGLANGGEWRGTRWTAVPSGTRAAGGRRQFVSRGAAFITLDILSDPVARTPGFGTETPFDWPFPVAVKTGTSHHFTDNWAVATTGAFTVVVWVGNFNGTPMRKISGVTGAGPLLHRAVLEVAKRYDPGVLPSPASAGAVHVTICRLSGLRAGRNCTGTDEWFLPGTEPGICDWHRGANAALPAEYAEWSPQSVSGELKIVSPRDGDRYEIPPGIDARYATIALRAVATRGDEPVRWSIDGKPTAAARWQLRSGRHRIRAIGASGRASEVSISVR